MNEQLLQYIWQNTLFDTKNIFTTKGEKIEIIRIGDINHNAGPDFFNAKIKIGDTLWAGNVEVHVNSSGWYEHHHNDDKAYNNVILHVVFHDNKECYTNSGYRLPCFVLPKNIGLIAKTEKLFQKKKWIFCESWLSKTSDISIRMWLESLLVERLQEKSALIQELFEHNKSSWEETFYQMLLRGFGFGANAEAFQEIAERTPLLTLAKYKNNVFLLEALLLGQANLLESVNIYDDYYDLLRREYTFLQKKHALVPIENCSVNFMRLRPPNFPTIRISQFAQLVHKSSGLFSLILEKHDVMQLKELFNVATSEYWKSHYSFGKKGKEQSKSLGEISINILLINVVVPMIFFYGKYNDTLDYTDFAISLLENIPSEINSITKQWEALGFKNETASDSQALYHLYSRYCKCKKCLFCSIGKTIIPKIAL